MALRVVCSGFPLHNGEVAAHVYIAAHHTGQVVDLLFDQPDAGGAGDTRDQQGDFFTALRQFMDEALLQRLIVPAVQTLQKTRYQFCGGGVARVALLSVLIVGFHADVDNGLGHRLTARATHGTGLL